ncbi:MAG: hypothetical protein IPJ89_00365 [Candidatus Iainarchaeum archaeon]|uniref:Uncharacterized protein n=1 Tax=Candidatus Iainarchaeum sp. TaxID=3101447 RepID=A0A7T9DJV9_9ARCH|nr:MAG: hypothetical protein IPJ89_00365 [Candidatus Diapherotrites archaeon]
MPKRFSKHYKTFSDWKKGRKLTKYSKKIIENRAIFPKSTLKRLRTGISNFSTKKWNVLNSTQKVHRTNALNTLSEIRKGNSLLKTLKKYGYSLERIKEHLGKTIHFQNNKWISRSRDSIERSMVIYENGKRKAILVNDSKTASRIGEYYNSVKKFLQTGNEKELHKINTKIIDSNGNTHYLETNPKKILEIEEAKEEPEFTEIYSEEDSP